jgi:hypothetical protein
MREMRGMVHVAEVFATDSTMPDPDWLHLVGTLIAVLRASRANISPPAMNWIKRRLQRHQVAQVYCSPSSANVPATTHSGDGRSLASADSTWSCRGWRRRRLLLAAAVVEGLLRLVRAPSCGTSSIHLKAFRSQQEGYGEAGAPRFKHLIFGFWTKPNGRDRSGPAVSLAF